MTDLPAAILDFIARQQQAGASGVSAGLLERQLQRPRATLNRALAGLLKERRIESRGRSRAITYRLPDAGGDAGAVLAREEPPSRAAAVPASRIAPPAVASPAWSGKALALWAELDAPLGTRKPVAYKREFVDDYEPNVSSLLPPELARELFERGRAQGQMPAATYARQVLQQLLIDLSWYSSRLEGNRKSLLDTRELFERGRTGAEDLDAVMLLNHKEAIEFLVEAMSTEGITHAVVRNLQSVLMNDLLSDPAGLGAIRRHVVQIQDTVYQPSQVPRLLEEMLEQIVEKARQIRNPVEAAFFFWVNIAYLQPFVDGNKRTSRLSANMPLMLFNCAPLSFLEVGSRDYAFAMVGVFEQRDVTLAVELFAWTYRRSIDKYRVLVESMNAPDPFRMRYRPQLTDVMQQIVFHGRAIGEALAGAGVAPEHAIAFRQMVEAELQTLEPFNCARHRLPMGTTQAWIARGRPR